MKTIGITGGTGFVGRHLTDLLVSEGHKVIIFTTKVAKKPATSQISYAHWHPYQGSCDINALKEVNAVVHLAGAGLADKLWTQKRKKEIVESRVKSTNFLVTQLKAHAPDCEVLIAASAIGIYGADTLDRPFTEEDPYATDFLGDTCMQWEKETSEASSFIRTVILRFGIILGNDSGAFPKLMRPMSFGIMPILGPGTQLVSWVEVSDLTRLIDFAMQNKLLSGVYNAVAPNPVTHRQLMKTIATAKGGIKIPMRIPSAVLKTVMGELSNELLKSCTVSAQKTLATGFTYNHPDVKSAVKKLLSRV
jgi:uncharacterized protein (TIGR01777 family)